MGFFKWLLNIVLGWFGLVNKKQIEADSKAAADARREQSSIEAGNNANKIDNAGKKAESGIQLLKPDDDDVFHTDDFNKKGGL